jgi:hypothetical protein
MASVRIVDVDVGGERKSELPIELNRTPSLVEVPTPAPAEHV